MSEFPWRENEPRCELSRDGGETWETMVVTFDGGWSWNWTPFILMPSEALGLPEDIERPKMLKSDVKLFMSGQQAEALYQRHKVLLRGLTRPKQ